MGTSCEVISQTLLVSGQGGRFLDFQVYFCGQANTFCAYAAPAFVSINIVLIADWFFSAHHTFSFPFFLNNQDICRKFNARDIDFGQMLQLLARSIPVNCLGEKKSLSSLSAQTHPPFSLLPRAVLDHRRRHENCICSFRYGQERQRFTRRAQVGRCQEPLDLNSMSPETACPGSVLSNFAFLLNLLSLFNPPLIRAMMHKLEERPTEQDIADIIQALDEDGDGQIDYKEFVKAMRGT